MIAQQKTRLPAQTSPLNRSWVRQTLALTIFLIGWEVLSRTGVLDPFFFPAPSAVALTLFELFTGGSTNIWPHLQATFTAALLGLVLGLALGILLGFVAALTPIVAELLTPVMMLLNAIPRVILAPLFVIWFGIDLPSKVALSLVLVTVLMFFAVYSGIREVDVRLVERIRTLGGGRNVLIREVYIPSVTSWVLTNLKVAVGFAFTGVVVGEFVSATRGLGYLLTQSLGTYNVALTVAIITLIMVFVLLLFWLSGKLEKRLLNWKVS